MKRIFSTLSFMTIVIALTVGCDKTDENEVPNIPLEVSTQSVSVEKGKVFPELLLLLQVAEIIQLVSLIKI